jgi:sugar/nucleoside kinase (ribokinase family)
MYSVFGLGNPLLDFIAPVGFPVLERTGAEQGTMNLVDAGRMQEILGLVGEYTNSPGGSCANTLRGISWLGRLSGAEGPSAAALIEPTVYCGAVGEDGPGAVYAEILGRAGVVQRLVRKPVPTGCSVILVTPDHERTMFTHLGACREYTWRDLDLAALAEARMFYCTGFMWDTENQKEAVMLAIDRAKALGLLVAFDIADPFVAQRYRLEFLGLIPSRVDILFGNREEFRHMFGAGHGDQVLLRQAGRLCRLVVMKIGAEGCYVNEDGSIHRVAGFPVQAVDTTAAGDCFAAGFLFGRLRNQEVEACARLANRLAAAIVTVRGCDFLTLDARRVLSEGR